MESRYVGPHDLHIEPIFPRFPSDGSSHDLAHVYTVLREDTQEVVQGPGLIRDAHRHRAAYPLRIGNGTRGGQLEKARVVAGVVLDLGLE